MRFEVLDISGDVGIRAFGRSLEELFINAASGMYNLITDTGAVEGRKSIDVEVQSHSLEGLLVSWLNELIFQFDTYGFIGKEIEIKEFSERGLKASLTGEEFDETRHEKRLLVKAATYHQLRIERKGENWKAEIIFDI
ncbi:MAG: archease [Thermodesulfovibrionales bacterium]